MHGPQLWCLFWSVKYVKINRSGSDLMLQVTACILQIWYNRPLLLSLMYIVWSLDLCLLWTDFKAIVSQKVAYPDEWEWISASYSGMSTTVKHAHDKKQRNLLIDTDFSFKWIFVLYCRTLLDVLFKSYKSMRLELLEALWNKSSIVKYVNCLMYAFEQNWLSSWNRKLYICMLGLLENLATTDGERNEEL